MTPLLDQVHEERYTLPTGREDVERLRLLDQIYAPATEALLDELALRADSRVADIGCGGGFMCARFAARFASGVVTGVDANSQQIEIARAYVHQRKLDNVGFVTASAYETGLPTGAFDLVFCRALLCHLQRPIDALAEMRRLLKPGGTLVCEDLDAPAVPADSVMHALAEFDVRVGAALGIDFYIGPKLPKLFQSVGVADPQIRFFHPVLLTGRQKRFVEYTYAAHMPFLIDAGIATREEIETHLAALRNMNDDETRGAAQFRLSQVWGRG